MYEILENQTLCRVVSRELANGLRYAFCESDSDLVDPYQIKSFLEGKYAQALSNLPAFQPERLYEKIPAMIRELEDPFTLYRFDMPGELLLHSAIEKAHLEYDPVNHPWPSSMKENEMDVLLEYFYSYERNLLLDEAGVDQYLRLKSDDSLCLRAYSDLMNAINFPEYNHELNGFGIYMDQDFLTYSGGETMDLSVFCETGDVPVSGSFKGESVDQIKPWHQDISGYRRIIFWDDFAKFLESSLGILSNSTDEHLLFTLMSQHNIHLLRKDGTTAPCVELGNDFLFGPYDDAGAAFLKIRSLLRSVPDSAAERKILWNYALQTSERTMPGIKSFIGKHSF